MDLEALETIEAPIPDEVEIAIDRAAKSIDDTMGKGAHGLLSRVTVNIGTLHGGMKVNVVPGNCVIECDMRIPVGLSKERIIDEVKRMLAYYPEVSMKEVNYSQPNWSHPQGEIARYIKSNAKMLRGFEPLPTLSLGATDCRLWRFRGIPAYIYGPTPNGVGATDEYVEIEEFFHIVRTHALSAYDYLTQ
jgi:succinyl-diaminopimelate desuccinylase